MKRIGSCALGIALVVWLSTLRGANAQVDIAIGHSVEVVVGTSVLNLRKMPGTDAPVVAKLNSGTRMTVVGGPQSADGYTWWELDGSPGRGWAAANFLRVSADDGASSTTRVGPNACDSSYRTMAGVSLCHYQDVRVVRIDLDSPHVRFETEMAQPGTPVDRAILERVSVTAMAERHPGVAAAINADYFGTGHGAEGLTIKNGVFLGPLPDNNRSALAIGPSGLDDPNFVGPIRAEVVRLRAFDPVPDATQYYTAIGGGPQVVFSNQWMWSRGRTGSWFWDCPADADVINGECFYASSAWDLPTKTWTVVGLTAENDMLWVVAPYSEIQKTLADWKVVTALKLDGGGSSQLWYDRQEVVRSPDARGVVNALLVYSLRAAEVVNGPIWIVASEGDAAEIHVSLKNVGADTWAASSVVLVNQENALGAGPMITLPNDVQPGETVTLSWTTQAISPWGIQSTRWRLSDGDLLFPGAGVDIQVVTVPTELANQRDKLEQQIQTWIEEQQQQIEELILDYIQKQLRSLLPVCPGWAFPMLGALGWIGQRRWRGPGARPSRGSTGP